MKRFGYELNTPYGIKLNEEMHTITFTLLNDLFGLSPMIVCTIDGKDDIYFACEEFVIDKYDKESIIKEEEKVKSWMTYDISLLGKLLK